MPISMECSKCMNVANVSDEVSAPVYCPHCQQPMSSNSTLPSSNVLVAAPRTESQGLSFDVESAITVGVFALLLISAVLFYLRF